MIDLLLDIVIALLLLSLAAGALFSPTLFGGIALFVAFGVLMALAWVRMNAPDLALTEAAIGAGLTGALLLIALEESHQAAVQTPHPKHWLPATFAAILLVTLLVTSAWPALDLRSPLAVMVEENIGESGVSHPVTAVLLNLRGWDTLLELVVLLLAFLGIKQLLPTHQYDLQPWRLLLSWSKHLAPLLVITGCYELWRGAAEPGGAFQAGALLASGAVMLRLAQVLPPLRWSQWPLRALVVVSVVVFISVAGATAWLGDGWLAYPRGWAKTLIVLIEVMATLSIATVLTLLVVGEGEEIHS